MARFHATKSKSPARKVAQPVVATALPEGAHLNWMGGPSYDVRSPLVRLRVAAASCFFGEPMYYHADKGEPPAKPKATRGATLTPEQRERLRDTLHAIDPDDWRGLSPSEMMERAIDAALDHDAEGALQLAVWLRGEEHVRTTPQVILVRAAHHPKVRGTGLVRRYAKAIVKRADEPAVGLAYQLWRFGKPVPNALKRAWADALAGFTPYELAKYRMESRAVKTVDVVNLCHAKSPAVDALCKAQLSNEGATWEAIVSAKGSSRETWAESLPKMGHMALLRNLRNLVTAGVAPAAFCDRLVAGAAKGQQLPFRYFSAHRALKGVAGVSGKVLDAVESCLTASLGNLPRLPGRVMSLCDNSGSARGATTSSMGTMAVATIANLTGLLAGLCGDEAEVGVFGDQLKTHAVRRAASVMDQLEALERLGNTVGGGTENGIWLFWDRAIRERQHWDHVFVFSDMQAGHGGLYGVNASDYADFRWGSSQYIDVPKLIAAYRARVNPHVNVYLVQVAGYQDALVPEFYERTYILGGWGEGLLRFAAEMAGLADAPPVPSQRGASAA
ncbi:MAG: TROVE domain-containing protein [Polyangiales bacterium]